MSRSSKNTAYLVKTDLIPDDTDVKIEDGAVYVKADKLVYHAENTKFELSPTASSGGSAVQVYNDDFYNFSSPLELISATNVSPINILTSSCAIQFKTDGSDIYDTVNTVFKPTTGNVYQFEISFNFNPDIAQNMLRFELKTSTIQLASSVYVCNKTFLNRGRATFDPILCSGASTSLGIGIFCNGTDSSGTTAPIYDVTVTIKDLGPSV